MRAISFVALLGVAASFAGMTILEACGDDSAPRGNDARTGGDAASESSSASNEAGGTPLSDGAASDASTGEGVDASDAASADAPVHDAGTDATDAAMGPDVPPPAYLPDGACGPHVVEAGTELGPCSVTEGEIVCDASSDCHVLPIASCCGSAFVGVNATNKASCPPPPCPPLTCPDVDAGGGSRTEYCEVVSSGIDVAAACVDGRCVAYAIPVGSE